MKDSLCHLHLEVLYRKDWNGGGPADPRGKTADKTEEMTMVAV